MKIQASIGVFACVGARELLLVQRRDNGLWNLLGGGVEDSDATGLRTPQEIVAREVEEEAGFIVYFKEDRPLGFYATASYSDVAITYSCGVRRGVLRLSDEVQQFGWFSPRGILSLAEKNQLVGGLKTKDGRVARHVQMCLHFFTRQTEPYFLREAVDICQSLKIPI